MVEIMYWDTWRDDHTEMINMLQGFTTSHNVKITFSPLTHINSHIMSTSVEWKQSKL